MNWNRQIIRTTILSTVLLFPMLVIPMIFGFGGQFADTTNLQNFTFYALGGIFLLTMTSMLTIERDIIHTAKYGFGLGFATPGEKPSIPFFKRFSNFQLFLISAIGFGLLGIVAFTKYPQVLFNLVPKQQFTSIDYPIFSSIMVAISENAQLAFIIGLTWLGLRFYAYKNKDSEFNFNVYAWSVVPLAAIYGLVTHILVHGSSEATLLQHALFWAYMAILVVLTGSVIPSLMFHFYNDFFISLRGYASNEATAIGMALVVLILIVIYIKMYGLGIRKKEDVSSVT